MSLENVVLSDIRPNIEEDGRHPNYVVRDSVNSLLYSKSKLAENNNLNPPDVRKFIDDYVSKKSKEDEKFGGIEDLPQVLEIFTKYMGLISDRVDSSVSQGKDLTLLAKNTVGRRCYGCNNFIKYMAESGYFTPELVDSSVEILKVSTEALSVIDSNAFESSRNNNPVQKAAVLADLIDLSVIYPFKADAVFNVIRNSCPKNIKSQGSREDFVKGALSEILTVYSILDSETVLGGDYQISKPSANNDVSDGTDFCVGRRNARNIYEDILYFEVRKGTPSSYGVCSLDLKNNALIAESCGMKLSHLIDEYDIENNVINCIKRRKIPFIVVRMKPDFDFSNDQEYNDFSNQIITEMDEKIKERI